MWERKSLYLGRRDYLDRRSARHRESLFKPCWQGWARQSRGLICRASESVFTTVIRTTWSIAATRTVSMMLRMKQFTVDLLYEYHSC